MAPSSSDIGNGIGSHYHRSALLYRGDAPGILGIPESAPGSGAIQTRLPTPSCFRNIPRDDQVIHQQESVRAPAPKIEFPKFDGENPKLWQQQCGTYLEVFRVQPCLHTRYAALGFQGKAALWFQGVEAKGRVEEWDHMCRLVHDYFGKNQEASYRHQMRILQQTGSVPEYWDKFSRLRHQLLVYSTLR
jgi:hypothetical protein